jgi:hypothetical protein
MNPLKSSLLLVVSLVAVACGGVTVDLAVATATKVPSGEQVNFPYCVIVEDKEILASGAGMTCVTDAATADKLAAAYAKSPTVLSVVVVKKQP